MLPVCVEIIATTYRSTIFKTYSFSLYSHLCIYVSICYLSTHSMSRLAARSDCQQFEKCLTMTIESTQRYTPRPWSSEFSDTIGDQDWVNSEMPWEAVIKWVLRWTLRPFSSEYPVAIRDRNWVNPEKHWEAVIEWGWRCSSRPRSSELRDAPWGRNRARWEMQL